MMEQQDVWDTKEPEVQEEGLEMMDLWEPKDLMVDQMHKAGEVYREQEVWKVLVMLLVLMVSMVTKGPLERL